MTRGQEKCIQPTLVVLPAHNEQASLAPVVQGLLALGVADVLVVDDKSGDGTAEAARRAGARVLRLPLHLGAWGAMQTGLRYALGKGYAVVVTMDADGQHLPATLPMVMDPVARGLADVAVGSCVERASQARRTAWKVLRRLAGLHISDLTSGFRAYNRKAMEILTDPRATLLDYQDVGVFLLLKKAGCSIVEVNVPMQPRLNGHSRIFNTWGCVFWYLLYSGTLCLSKTRHFSIRPTNGWCRP